MCALREPAMPCMTPQETCQSDAWAVLNTGLPFTVTVPRKAKNASLSASAWHWVSELGSEQALQVHPASAIRIRLRSRRP